MMAMGKRGMMRKGAAAVLALFLSAAAIGGAEASKEVKEIMNLIIGISRRHEQPFLYINPERAETYVTNIWYIDYEKKQVNYDSWPGLAYVTRYRQEDGMIESIERIHVYKEREEVYWAEEYGIEGNTMTRKDVWAPDGVEEVSWAEYELVGGAEGPRRGDPQGEGRGGGDGVSRIKIEQVEGGYDMFSYGKKSYTVRIDGEITTMTEDNGDFYKYRRGILIEKDQGTYAERYGVIEGKGTYERRIGEDGEYEIVGEVERRLDGDGYLEYERISYYPTESSGKSIWAYEYTVGDSMADVSELSN